MKNAGGGTAIHTRALECAVAAAVALVAADGIRAALGPFWRVFGLLFGG
jgi:hypothetical protein